MSQGISSSLNLMLARISSIESNFNALEGVANNINSKVEMPQNNVKNEDFKTILDKITKKDDFDELKTDEIPKEIKETLYEDNDNSLIKEVNEANTIETNENAKPAKAVEENRRKREAIELKSKIELKSQSANVDEIIETFSDKYGVDSDFIKAIIKQESGFNPKATSKKGAMGLMQLMPKTAKSLGVTNAYNPWENIEGGVKHINRLLKKYDNNYELALAAYNAGEGAVKRYGGIPPYKETQNYVNSIISSFNKLKEAKI